MNQIQTTLHAADQAAQFTAHARVFHTREMEAAGAAANLELMLRIGCRDLRAVSLGGSTVLRPLTAGGLCFLEKYAGLVIDAVQVAQFRQQYGQQESRPAPRPVCTRHYAVCKADRFCRFCGGRDPQVGPATRD